MAVCRQLGAASRAQGQLCEPCELLSVAFIVARSKTLGAASKAQCQLLMKRKREVMNDDLTMVVMI